MEIKEKTILGTFEGECADADITNLNGLDITRDVWTNVFNSDDYKKAIDLGWYIGFLGHPEDPNCMDFKDACIVMTDGNIDDNGKVYGKFNLIDTPVGRIVKSFIDAGVTFGISVRGAGDIENNSVDPDTFVFRGFDLVSFPAYPESIPVFKSIAASSDTTTQANYKKVCKTVTANLDEINSKESLTIIKSCFAPQSDEYKQVQSKLDILSEDVEVIEDVEPVEDVEQVEDSEVVEDVEVVEAESDEPIEPEIDEVAALKTRLAGVEMLLKETLQKYNDVQTKLDASEQNNKHLVLTSNRKLASFKRIAESQTTLLKKKLDKVEFDNAVMSNTLKKVKSTNIQTSKLNLKYRMKIDSNDKILEEKNRLIASLKLENSKTVETIQANTTTITNLEKKIKSLSTKIQSDETIIAEYQEAYAIMYANAIGTQTDAISVTSSTTVGELERAIRRGASRRVAVMSAYQPDEELYEVDDYSNDIVAV